MGACLSLMPAYSTSKEVTLLDRKLGILYAVCTIMVLIYVVGVRVVVERGYYSTEKSYGIVEARLSGTTYSLRGVAGSKQRVPVPYDVASLVQYDERDALFLPTRWVTTRSQRLDHCSNPDEPCEADADCAHEPPLAIGVCNNKRCTRHMWCNAKPTPTCLASTEPDCTAGEGQPSDPFGAGAAGGAGGGMREEEELQDFGEISIWPVAAIYFSTGLHSEAALTTEDTLRDSRHRWNLTEVIQRSRMTEADVRSKGGVLELTLRWDCENLAYPDECKPYMKVTQLGEGEPFFKAWASYSRPAGDGGDRGAVRDLHQARGLRLVVRSEGRGQRVDVLQIVQQLFVALALMPIAAGLADFIMQNLFAERRHYREYKTENSPDFSDVRAKVEQLEKQSRSRQAKAMNYA